MTDVYPLDCDESDGGGFDNSKQRAAQQANWEQRIVKELLKANTKSVVSFKELQTFARNHGREHVIFHDLLKYHAFPVYLHCQKIPYMYKITHEDIFSGFKRLTNKFFELESELPVGRNQRRGLVFEWLHAKGAIKILHNSNELNLYDQGVKVIWSTHHKDKLVLCNFSDFMHNIGWAN